MLVFRKVGLSYYLRIPLLSVHLYLDSRAIIFYIAAIRQKVIIEMMKFLQFIPKAIIMRVLRNDPLPTYHHLLFEPAAKTQNLHESTLSSALLADQQHNLRNWNISRFHQRSNISYFYCLHDV